MVYNTDYNNASGIGQKASRPRPFLPRNLTTHGTTAIERLLLIASIVLLPLGNDLPAIGRFSSMYLLFGAVGCYLLIRRPSALGRTSMHPVFMTAYGWVLLGFLMESVHPDANYFEPIRIAQMIVGAVFVASLCRDRPALRAAMNGYLIAGLWMSIFLVAIAYGALSDIEADDFAEATNVRNMTFQDSAMPSGVKGLNGRAFTAAQGTVVALVLVLTTRSFRWRVVCFGIALFCAIATTLVMSRGAIAIAAIASGAVMFAYGVTRIKTIAVVTILGAGLLVWVPDAVYSRLTFSTETTHGRTEARARLVLASVEHLPEYLLTGVGAGNFWKSWGRETSFYKRKTHGGKVQGAHNSFIQVTLYWGLIGLFSLVAVIYQAYRCLPRQCGADTLSLCLLGIAISLLLLLLVSHVIADKSFSLGLGLLVGIQSWIWPRGIVPSTTRKHRDFRAILSSRSPRRAANGIR